MDIIGATLINAHPAVISGKGKIVYGPIQLVVCKSCGKDITIKDCECEENQTFRDRSKAN